LKVIDNDDDENMMMLMNIIMHNKSEPEAYVEGEDEVNWMLL
jgi:hypothetical protein